MKTIAIIQARMGSTRLPGKMSRKILGMTVLERLVERIQTAKSLSQVIIATTHLKADDVIASIAQKLKLNCFRGSSDDVLERFYQATQIYPSDTIVRICGDSPLIDPAIIDLLVKTFTPRLDYVSNLHPRSFPQGVEAEVFSTSTLNAIHHQAISAYDREHVTPYIYNHPRQFRLKNILAAPELNRPDIHLTVDTKADLIRVRSIYRHLYAKNHHFSTFDIIQLCSEPSIAV